MHGPRRIIRGTARLTNGTRRSTRILALHLVHAGYKLHNRLRLKQFRNRPLERLFGGGQQYAVQPVRLEHPAFRPFPDYRSERVHSDLGHFLRHPFVAVGILRRAHRQGQVIGVRAPAGFRTHNPGDGGLLLAPAAPQLFALAAPQLLALAVPRLAAFPAPRCTCGLFFLQHAVVQHSTAVDHVYLVSGPVPQDAHAMGSLFRRKPDEPVKNLI